MVAGLICNQISVGYLYSVRMKVNSLKSLLADGFFLSILPQGATPSFPNRSVRDRLFAVRLSSRRSPGLPIFRPYWAKPQESEEINTAKIWNCSLLFGIDLDRSECIGRQNARLRVRFDIPIAIGIVSFSSNGKGRASPA